MKIAITGVPGAGKTTLAAALAAEFGLVIITAGDIARGVDPMCIIEGRMADPVKLREGVEALVQKGDGWVLDGYPRTVDQLDSITDDVELILLTCRPDVARERLLRRGRRDDTEEIIAKRTEKQTRLMALDVQGGWVFQRATWRRSMNTTNRRPTEVAAGVVAYLKGEKREIV